MMTALPVTSCQYLTRIPGVCAGRTIIEGTRIGVPDFVGLIDNGAVFDADPVRAVTGVLSTSRSRACRAGRATHTDDLALRGVLPALQGGCESRK